MKRKLMGKAVGSGCEGGGYGERSLTLLFIMKAVWRVIPQAKIVMALVVRRYVGTVEFFKKEMQLLPSNRAQLGAAKFLCVLWAECNTTTVRGISFRSTALVLIDKNASFTHTLSL
jgi:hypothetical protein